MGFQLLYHPCVKLCLTSTLTFRKGFERKNCPRKKKKKIMVIRELLSGQLTVFSVLRIGMFTQRKEEPSSCRHTALCHGISTLRPL